MELFCGIDIGSSSTKIVIINDKKVIVGHITQPTGASFNKNAVAALDSLLQERDINKYHVKYCVSTGYGRKLFKSSNESISEITANATGVFHMEGANNGVKTIINIGGQDSKIIRVDQYGGVTDFVMNDKCAAGTGKFLEMASRNLEVDIDDLGVIHNGFEGIPSTINSTCTVFAESEIISLLAEGVSIPEVVAGVHHSIARRIVRLAKRVGTEEKIIFDGGTALNTGMQKALSIELMMEITIPKYPQLTTAFGAAIIARESLKNPLIA